MVVAIGLLRVPRLILFRRLKEVRKPPLTGAMWKPILTVAINLTFLPLLFRLTSFRLPLMLQFSLPSLQRCCPLALPPILPLAPLMSLYSLLTPQAYLPVLLLPRLWMLPLPLVLANYLLTWFC